MAHEENESEQRELRKSILRTFSGESSLNLKVLQFPSDPELVEEYRRNIGRIADALEAQKS